MMCGEQGLALRGHRESGNLVVHNDGNFRALSRFWIDLGDPVLRDHLLSARQSAMYVSPGIQNEIIDIIGKIFPKKIIAEVTPSGIFTVLADGTQGCGKTDQLTICLRYVTTKNQQQILVGKFLIFCEVTDRTGEGSARSILEWLTSEGMTWRRWEDKDTMDVLRWVVGRKESKHISKPKFLKHYFSTVQAIVPWETWEKRSSPCLNLAVYTPQKSA